MDIEDIHEFQSSSEFEQDYFLSLTKKAEDAPQPKNPLAGVSPETVKYLNGTTFSADPAFSDEVVDVEISADKNQILKVSSSKLFGRPITEILANALTLDSFVAPEMAAEFKALLQEIDAKSTTPKLLAIKTGNQNEIWTIDATGTKNDKSYNLKLHDKTRSTAKILGKEKGEDEAKKEEKKQPVDIIIFRYTCVASKDVKKWVTKAAALLKKAGLWPEANRPKFIVVRYEDDGKEKAEFNHPFIDDLLCLPFDRLIFLQKIEIVLNLPKKISPSYLFVQEASDDIELSKRVTLERGCDLGFAMTNPIPLAQGTTGHFYFRFPGQKPLLDVFGKAYTSIPHPDREGAHLVYFNFFGLNKSMNKEVKAYLNRDTAYKNLVDQDAARFAYNPDSIFLTEEQKRRKTVAFLDFDENVVKNSLDYLKSEIGHIDIVSEDTYFSFFKKYLDKKVDSEKALPAKSEDFYAEIVSFLIGSVELNLQMVLTPPAENDKLLGHEAQKMFAEPQAWLSLFDGDARNLLTECLHLVQNTKRIQKNFELKYGENELRTVSVEFILEEASQIVRVNVRVPDSKQSLRIGQLARIESLECVIVDYALLPDDPDAFINGLRDACAKNNVRTYPEGPRVIVMASETQRVNVDRLLKSKVFAFLYKPLEIRRLMYLAAAAMEAPHSLYNFENIGWKADLITAKIARPAKLVELSEFGATLKSEQPLKPGTMLYLFKSIFNSAPDQNLCVRVYASQEDDSEKGTYLNSVVYFGITDAFLKFTRSYIRETYASKKSKEGQG
jgi:hypothetical protein